MPPLDDAKLVLESGAEAAESGGARERILGDREAIVRRELGLDLGEGKGEGEGEGNA